MKRLIEKIVFSGFITAWRFATVPTRRSPESVKATTEGVVRPPSAFSSTVGSSPSITAMAEFVVPRSIPIVFATSFLQSRVLVLLQHSRLKNLSVSLADSRKAVQAQNEKRPPPWRGPFSRCRCGSARREPGSLGSLDGQLTEEA